MEIPWQRLAPETLSALLEEIVSRDGTDYGDRELTREAKMSQIRRRLEAGRATLTFDPETETCNLIEAITARGPRPDSDPDPSP